MTSSKHLLVLCAIAAGAVCLTVRADDTDNAAQSAARIALAKALFEQSSNVPAASADTNVVMQPVNNKEAEKEAKAKAKADKAAAKAKAKADKEAAEAKAKQDAAQAQEDKKAREAADKKAAEDAQAAALQKQAQADADKAAAEQKERAAIAAAMPVAATTNTETQAQGMTPATTNSWASAPASESHPATASKKEKKKKEKEKEQATAATPASPQQPGQDLGMKPIMAPPLPISATKEQQLDALLQKYRADQITPDEYHAQRAAILAEP